MAVDLVASFLDRFRLAALIQAIEDDLRAFLRAYVTPYFDAEPLMGEKYGELSSRAAKDGIRDLTAALLVDYLDFGDSFALLNGHREMLPEKVGTAVRAFTPAFETATPIRNRVMHGRPLQPGDEEHIAKLGEVLADSDVEFPMCRAVAKRLVEEPDWSPFTEIASTAYGEVLHNLPLPEFDETGLLGREDELRRLRELAMNPRFPVVTIAGEGGIGKTALAVQALYELADSKSAPYSAILWVSLKTERLTGRGVEQLREAAFDFLSVTEELSSALGPATDDIELLAQVLQGTPTLVAIDNIESISHDDVKRLIEALPECQFLITSRVGLGELEIRIALGALSEQSSKAMMRRLAERRGLSQLARAKDKQATKIVDALRRSPLAIRWFVEAVEVGGQPDELIRDQSTVLQFSMSTIYDSLARDAHRIVEALLALDRSATIGHLALLTDLERDEVQQQVYELQRRSLIVVDNELGETLSQSYALADMAREYLVRFGSVDAAFNEEVRKRLREIRHSEMVMQQHDNRIALEPAAVVAENPEEMAVARLLRLALARSRAPVHDLAGARALVERARDAVPGYFETYRVEGFIESDQRPEQARRSYEEAFRLAPDAHKPKVGYWLAGHLAKDSFARDEAAHYAELAHKGLGLPGTAERLGRIRMYQQRFDEAESLIRVAANEGAGRLRVIAETALIEVAKRRAEHLAEEEKMSAAALEAILPALGRGDTFLSEGANDRRYNDAFVELVAEGLLVVLRSDDATLLSPQIGKLLETLDRRFAIASSPGRRELWESRIQWLLDRDDLDEELRAYAGKLTTRLARHSAATGTGRQTGDIASFNGQKNFGFIRTGDGESVFFHRDEVAESSDRVMLMRGVEVTFDPAESLRDGTVRSRAENVSVALSAEQRARALRDRRGIVDTRTETYLFAKEILSGERVFVHRTAFKSRDDWAKASMGGVVLFDLEYGSRGVKALTRSASLEAT